METIMMLNNNIINDTSFITGLLSGGLSGIVVTFAFWFLTTRLLIPRLKISSDIAYKIIEEEREEKYSSEKIIKKSYNAHVYRIKLANNSIRKAFDIKIFFRLRYNNHYATIELPYQPCLMGNKNIFRRWLDKMKGIKETYEHHKTIPFRLTDIRMSKIIGYNIPELKQKYTEGVLSLDDFKKDDTIVEFVVMTFDNISGSSLRILAKRFSQKDLDEHVKEGDFLDGEMEIRSKSKTPEE